MLGTFTSNAQTTSSYTSEISLSSANDAFVIWQNSDRFYSYGIGLNWKFRSDNFLRLQRLFPQKTNHFFSIGFRLEGFTPSNKTVSEQEIFQNTFSFDRPFAGVSYAFINTSYFFENYFIKGGLLLGVMGPSSLAGDFQDWFHDKITDDPVFDEWKCEIPNQLIMNLNLKIVKDFTPKLKWFDLFGAVETRLGNLYIDTTPEVGFRIGKFNKISESIGFENSILGSSNDFELFFQFTASGSANLYDATAQGNLFDRNFQFVVDELNTFSSVLSPSIYFSSKKYALGIEHYFTFGKVVSGEQHVYARAIFTYRF